MPQPQLMLTLSPAGTLQAELPRPKRSPPRPTARRPPIRHS